MPAVLVAAGLAALYLVLDPPSADLAAQVYRVGLFEREGWTAWDNYWYGGHHLPGYSVLFPPLGAALGPAVVGALSVVAATAGFARLVSYTPAAIWFAAGMTATVVSGRLAFALGAAVAAWATVAAQRRRTPAAAIAGAATALASPVAALFVALAAAALWHQRRDAASAAVVLGAAVVTATLVIAFPEGGSEPFVASAFWPALLAAAVLAAVSRGAVRVGAAAYALVLVAAFLIDTPLGGNATRLGALLGGPIAVALLWSDRRRALAVVAVPLAYWTLYPAVRDWTQAAGDPARAASYHAPLLARLATEPRPFRLEIPFTEGHWESAHVAGGPDPIPLARGWQRQLDRKVNPLFYEGRLTAARYRAWLQDNAVRWVALPDAPLDYSAEAEATLIRAGLPYLDEVWRSEHWRLFAVRRPAPLGATALGHDWFVTAGGEVKVRWTPYWAVVGGRGCVQRGAGEWTRVEPREGAAAVRVGIRVTPERVLSDAPRCR